MPTWITGILTGGFSFLSEWWKGKQEQAKQELAIQQAQANTINQIKLKQVSGEVDNDAISLEDMKNGWKDDWLLILFSMPLIAMFVSPFLDLFMMEGDYQQGMLAQAAMQALHNLDAAPDFYTYIMTVIVMVVYGYRKGVDKLFSLFSKKK